MPDYRFLVMEEAREISLPQKKIGLFWSAFRSKSRKSF
jgi:hypothetical protein